MTACGDIIPGDWRSVPETENGLANMSRLGSNHYNFDAGRVREDFKGYFNSKTGDVPWQLKHVRSCGKINE